MRKRERERRKWIGNDQRIKETERKLNRKREREEKAMK